MVRIGAFPALGPGSIPGIGKHIDNILYHRLLSDMV